MTDTLHTQHLTKFVTFRLSRLQSRLNAQAIRLLRDNSDLSLTEWRIIAMAASHDEMTLSQLARLTQLDKGQLSRAVSTLVTKGLLTSKVNDEDHRQNILAVTESGHNAHDAVFPIMQNRQAQLTSKLSASDVAVLNELLDKLESTLDEPS